MKCFFINLDDATARRARLEADFAALAPASWSLQRFRAVTAGDVLAAQCPGELRPVEKACFLSHRRLIEQNEGSSSPLFILEDDAKLGRHTARMLNEFLGANPHLAWDLLYTDVIVPEIGDVVNLIRTRRECEQQRGIALINLERLRFGGATAYLVNSRSLGKLARLLREKTDGTRLVSLSHDRCGGCRRFPDTARGVRNHGTRMGYVPNHDVVRTGQRSGDGRAQPTSCAGLR